MIFWPSFLYFYVLKVIMAKDKKARQKLGKQFLAHTRIRILISRIYHKKSTTQWKNKKRVRKNNSGKKYN